VNDELRPISTDHYLTWARQVAADLVYGDHDDAVCVALFVLATYPSPLLDD